MGGRGREGALDGVKRENLEEEKPRRGAGGTAGNTDAHATDSRHGAKP
jgi:hypothetical protein